MKYELAAFADEVSTNLDAQINAMRDNGIRYLEIRGVEGENVDNITVNKAKYIYEKLSDAGLAVWSIGSPFGKIGMGDDFDVHLEKFKRCLEVADILGARNMRMFSFYVPADNRERYKDEVFERIGRFAEAAKGSDILLCHENEKGIYGDKAAGCLEIHREFPSIRAVFDPANYVQCGQDTIEAWELLSGYVEYMHIKDALADGSVVPAGKGIGNLPYILENYKGKVLTIEPHLTVFEGFEKLEEDKKTKMGYCYPSSRAAFDAAVSALKNLL